MTFEIAKISDSAFCDNLSVLSSSSATSSTDKKSSGTSSGHSSGGTAATQQFSGTSAISLHQSSSINRSSSQHNHVQSKKLIFTSLSLM